MKMINSCYFRNFDKFSNTLFRLRNVSGLCVGSKNLKKTNSLSVNIRYYSSEGPNLGDTFYSEQHRQLQKTVQKIIVSDINPHIDKWEAERIFPAHELFKKLGNAGILGVTKPVEYGGMNLDYTYSVAVAETLGTIRCGGVPMAIGVQCDMATPALARYGSDKLKRNFLAPSIAGDVVTCIGVSEVGAGSDVSSIKTSASRKGDDLIINGGKMWITNGMQADWMCLLANTSDGPVHRSKSLICLPLDAKGVIRAKIEKMGMHSSDTAQFYFEDVRVPYDHIIGKEGQGFIYQMQQFQEERMTGAACAIGVLDTALKETIKYCQERQVFGKSVLDHQYVHFTLAEQATEVEALRALVYKTAELYAKGHDVTKYASMAKLKAGRLCRSVIDTCLQFWGGMGFTEDVLISRMYRDHRLISIGAGADEVMMGIIAKYMGALSKTKGL